MLKKQSNEEWIYNGQRFYIGQRIIGTEQSEYEGLFGTVWEIRDGKDKETENETPDIYCSFDAPKLPYDIQQLEKTFSDLYGTPKTIEDIVLDEVIMSPDMIAPLDTVLPQKTVYMLIEDWAHQGETGFRYRIYSDKNEAKKQMRLTFDRDLEEGFFEGLRSEPDADVIEESDENHYEIFRDGFYCEEHYALTIEEHILLGENGG